MDHNVTTVPLLKPFDRHNSAVPDQGDLSPQELCKACQQFRETQSCPCVLVALLKGGKRTTILSV